MIRWRLVVTVARKNGEWSGVVESPELMVDADSVDDAVTVVREWLEAAGLSVLGFRVVEG